MKKMIFMAAAALLLVLWPASAALAGGSYYIACEQETVASIAETYGLDSELLALMNDVAATEPLAEGTVLRLPETPCFSVTVSRGDTLSSLARRYAVDIAEITRVNELDSQGRLYPGQTLLIPFGEEISVSAVASVEAPELAVYASRSALAYIWPVDGFISSSYGERWGSFHWGLDIAADNLSEIGAAAAGVVVEAGWKNDAYGYAVVIDHGDGRQTLYGHCSSVVAQVGDQVRTGETVALVGSTGNSTGPHLHFEIRENGVCVDPLLYLPVNESAGSSK